MVGAVIFDLTPSCPRNTRASQATLRPDSEELNLPPVARNCNLNLELGPSKRFSRSMIGMGTVLNAAGILLGGILGLTLTKQLPTSRQVALKGLLGVFTVYVGLN